MTLKTYALAALLTQVMPGSPFQGGGGGAAVPWSTAAGGGIILPDGTAAEPSLVFASSLTTGIFRSSSNVLGIAASGVNQATFGGTGLILRSDRPLVWSSGAIGAASDTVVQRHSAGVLRLGDDTASSIRSLQGGGAAVASAAALPLPTGRVFHVTGTTSVTSITSTNFEAGVCITLIFDGILTMTDGGNLLLAGNFATSAFDTMSLCYDGTNWHETGRSAN